MSDDSPALGRKLATAEMEARARQLVADALRSGEAGELDRDIFAKLKAGLAARRRAADRS